MGSQTIFCIARFKNLQSQISNFAQVRAANNFSFLKGRMSDQVSILVGQSRNVVGHFFFFNFKWKAFKIIISYHYLLIIWLEICPDIMSDQG